MECDIVSGNKSKSKKIRKRKKKLYRGIREQMEFYFSDSNISKDRFMNHLLEESENGYIEFEAFLNFNKINSLTNDVKEIARALASSQILEVSQDGTKVKRITPFAKNVRNVDECTVYVERLPPQADHDWLKSVFSKYGDVTYVSLPKYKHTGKVKGFAFVEFSSSEAVMKTCKNFGYEGANVKSEDSTDSEIPSKRLRTEEGNKEGDKPQVEVKEDEKLDVKKEGGESETGEETEGEKTEDKKDKDQQKKKRKRKRRKKTVQPEETETISLMVMPKLEWKRLRNKYLSLQKATMTQIKKSLLGHPHHYSPSNPVSPEKEVQPKHEELKFEPNIIVKLESEKPITCADEFKQTLRKFDGVAYIDVVEGTSTAYVRCHNQESAQQLMDRGKESFCGSLSVLKDEEESVYWKKIEQDRENRRNQKSRQKKRGIEKVMAKAQKLMEKQNQHIYFDD